MSSDLFSAYPSVSAETWLEQITRELKGKTPEQMHWSPDGDLAVNPYVHAEDAGESLPALRHFGNWQIGEAFTPEDAAEGNTQILTALQGGVESISLTCPDDMDWERLLDGVSLPLIHAHLSISGDAEKGFQAFVRYAERQAVFIDLSISVNGLYPAHQNVRCASGTSSFAGKIVDDLADTLLLALDEAAYNPEKLARTDLSLHIGTHFLIEIGRLRACRILWENLGDAIGFDIPGAFSLNVTTKEPAENDDPYTHMIRAAFMGTAAVLGGADRVFVTPAQGGERSEAFYRHTARNISHLLRYESRFTEIPDPVAGAYYIDTLTKDLVQKTWAVLVRRMKESDR